MPSVDTISDDTILFHRNVKARYDGKDVPFFVLAFSMGCMQMLNIIKRRYIQNKGDDLMPIKYDGLFLSNPFWGFDNKSAHYMVPLLKVVKYMNPSFKTPERKIDFKKVPNHI